MTNNIKQEYEARVKRMRDVINKRVPDYVPVVLNAQYWVMNYAGISVKEACLENSDLLFEAYKKYLTDVYNDAILDVSNIAPINITEILGRGLYVVDDKCWQIVGSGGQTMDASEYPELIKNPNDFIANVLTPRKYPLLAEQSFDKNVEIMKSVYKDFGAWLKYNAANVEIMKSVYKDFGAWLKYNAAAVKRIEEEVGVPLFVDGSNLHPMDAVLDFFRDFVGITMDIKRIPDVLYNACAALYDYIIDMFLETEPPASDDKMLFSPLHIPTYLNPRDFGKLYYPFLKKYVQEISVDRGHALYIFMENEWGPYMEYLQDLPKEARLVLLFEHGDLKNYKDKLGKHFTIMGGMPISTLNYGTKQNCIDKAKECIDTLAPGGNYIFSIDRILMTLNDAKPENVIETARFAHEYGKY